MKGHFEDLTGTVGPYYTVLRRYGTYRAPNGKSSAVLWLCRCGCGTEFATRAADVKRGRIKSCGCLRERVRGKGEGGDHGCLAVFACKISEKFAYMQEFL